MSRPDIADLMRELEGEIKQTVKIATTEPTASPPDFKLDPRRFYETLVKVVKTFNDAYGADRIRILPSPDKIDRFIDEAASSSTSSSIKISVYYSLAPDDEKFYSKLKPADENDINDITELLVNIDIATKFVPTKRGDIPDGQWNYDYNVIFKQIYIALQAALETRRERNNTRLSFQSILLTRPAEGDGK